MKRIKHWIAVAISKFLRKSGSTLLVYVDDIGAIACLNGDAKELGNAALNVADKQRQVFSFFATVVFSYLVEYQTEERVFLDKLEKAKKEAAENFRRPY